MSLAGPVLSDPSIPAYGIPVSAPLASEYSLNTNGDVCAAGVNSNVQRGSSQKPPSITQAFKTIQLSERAARSFCIKIGPTVEGLLRADTSNP